MVIESEKQGIEREIDRARDDLGERIDELDRRLRTQFDVKAMAIEHAPQIMAGGAVIGFLAAFGFTRPLRRVVSIGIPLALLAMKIMNSRAGKGD
ncbi:MAG: DUF3618 domain-containing protein [Thermoanaerobaculia bacterium]